MDDPHTLLEQMRSSLAMHKAKKIREDQVRRNKEYFTEVLIEILRPYSEAIVGIDIGELRAHSAHYLLSSEEIRRANIIPPADGTVVGVSMDADLDISSTTCRTRFQTYSAHCVVVGPGAGHSKCDRDKYLQDIGREAGTDPARLMGGSRRRL